MKNILIIGGGTAGLSAAVSAAEAGASVTVLEQRKYLCGNGRYAEGVFGAGSRLQKRLNIDADPEALFRQAMEYSHWRANARLVRRLIGASGQTVDWLADLGVPFSRVLHHMPNQSPEVFHMAYPSPTGLQVMKTLQARAEALGVTLVTETRVTELFMENRDNMLSELNGFISELTKYRDAIENRDEELLAMLLKEGKNRKQAIESGEIIKREEASKCEDATEDCIECRLNQ